MNSQYGSVELPQYWITFGNEIIFDYPIQFVVRDETGCFVKNLQVEKLYYPYDTDISFISDLIREYIDTPKDEVFSKHFENDYWGLINILKVADRRNGIWFGT